MKNFSSAKLLAIAFLFLFFAACKTDKKDKNEKTKSPVTTPKTDTAKVDTMKVEPIKEVKDTVKVVEAKEAEVIKADNNLVKEEFYVIGGSFKELKRAENLQKTLKKKGYEAQVLKPYNGFNRVAIRAYANETKAREELAKLRKSFNDVSFWLLMAN